MAAVPTHPRTPYGGADFCRIRLNRWLYVDRPALRLPEQERYAFLIRPRRLGKSLWVSLPENYYDRFWGHQFDQVFAGTDIGANRPTNRAATSPCAYLRVTSSARRAIWGLR